MIVKLRMKKVQSVVFVSKNADLNYMNKTLNYIISHCEYLKNSNEKYQEFFSKSRPDGTDGPEVEVSYGREKEGDLTNNSEQFQSLFYINLITVPTASLESSIVSDKMKNNIDVTTGVDNGVDNVGDNVKTVNEDSTSTAIVEERRKSQEYFVKFRPFSTIPPPTTTTTNNTNDSNDTNPMIHSENNNNNNDNDNAAADVTNILKHEPNGQPGVSVSFDKHLVINTDIGDTNSNSNSKRRFSRRHRRTRTTHSTNKGDMNGNGIGNGINKGNEHFNINIDTNINNNVTTDTTNSTNMNNSNKSVRSVRPSHPVRPVCPLPQLNFDSFGCHPD